MPRNARKLEDLESIGQAMLKDFALLGIKSVDDLSRRDPELLYKRLSKLTGTRQDICVLDTFRCAVAQARNPALPKEQRKWWYYSRMRKSGKGS